MNLEEEQFNKDFAAWLAKMEEKIKVTKESEILTAEDYNIRINTIQD